MTIFLSRMIAYGCLFLMISIPLAALYFLIDLESFTSLAKQVLAEPYHWHTITNWQWYGFWAISVTYLSIGLIGVYFLHRAFSNFATGELFNLANSQNIKRFARLLLAQALARPLYDAASSLLLSFNHAPGQKKLFLSFGSHELGAIAIAVVFLVMSNLLVEGCKLKSENQQFV